MKTYTGWAIDTQSEEGLGLIGRFWWFGLTPPNIPKNMRGHRISLFETRREARENLPSVKRAYPRAIVIKVDISISKQVKP
jgi:hypothetical protein